MSVPTLEHKPLEMGEDECHVGHFALFQEHKAQAGSHTSVVSGKQIVFWF